MTNPLHYFLDEAPDLHDLYGKAFEKAYLGYEEKAQQGLIKNFEVVSAKKFVA